MRFSDSGRLGCVAMDESMRLNLAGVFALCQDTLLRPRWISCLCAAQRTSMTVARLGTFAGASSQPPPAAAGQIGWDLTDETSRRHRAIMQNASKKNRVPASCPATPAESWHGESWLQVPRFRAASCGRWSGGHTTAQLYGSRQLSEQLCC